MADKGIEGVGQGFFTEAGKLKSKEDIRVEEQRASEAKKAQAEAAPQKVDTTELSSQNIEEAFGRVRSRFNEQANNAINAINQEQEDLKAARKVVKEQISVARDLEQALQDGDQEAAQVSRKKLEELQTRRNELAETINARDEEKLPVRRQTISLGNEKLATVEVPRVKLEETRTEASELDKPKEVKQFIKSLKNDLETLNAQGQELREAKREVKDAVAEGSARIAATEEGTIRQFEKAQETAAKVSNEVQTSSRETAFNAIGNLGADMVRQLISG